MVPELCGGINYAIKYDIYYSPNLKYKTKNVSGDFGFSQKCI
jgi:hypothetical protein